MTRPAQQDETAIEHATQDGSHATQYDLRAPQYPGESCDRRKVGPVPRPGGQRNRRFYLRRPIVWTFDGLIGPTLLSHEEDSAASGV